ncbi:hypothetical protein PSNTI_34740 [Stutzerimonas stutzeri]|nr:conserved hypothetical protein [Stutzerimonas stutzeri DSM 4166]GBC57982.1 hypothetical protein PSNTI_34740 [Stutzerimonas stutzeri]
MKWTGREGAAAGCPADARASPSGWAPANRSPRYRPPRAKAAPQPDGAARPTRSVTARAPPAWRQAHIGALPERSSTIDSGGEIVA